MTESHPEGEHMELDIFRRALEFSRVDMPVLLISGGEPTELPKRKLVLLLKLAQREGYASVLLTNGTFFREKPELAAEIKPLVRAIQVTNDPRFYPKRVKLPPGQECEDHIRSVSPFGKMRNQRGVCTRQTPFCFNLRSTIRFFKNLTLALIHLRQSGKMCTPSVNWDGTVVAGEAPECLPIGTVESTPEEITNAIMKLECNHCGLMDNLDGRHLRAVGMVK